MIATISFRELNATDSEARLALYVLLLLIGIVIIICGSLFSVIVIGGATRNLVAHLLSNEPVSARATYRAVKERFWSLLGGSFLVALWLALAASVPSMGGGMVFWFVAIASFLLSNISPWLTGIVVALGIIAATVLGLCLFFLLAGRAAYVPQAILVEGRTVFDPIGRSLGLASGNVRDLMAITLVTDFATYSALLLLLIPLGWYGSLNGVDLSPLGTAWPTWYAIGYQVILQCSHILLAPILMLGLSLLYVDQRVRHEGYDIELKAAHQLSEMPKLPGDV